jgi:hypothetical protein
MAEATSACHAILDATPSPASICDLQLRFMKAMLLDL